MSCGLRLRAALSRSTRPAPCNIPPQPVDGQLAMDKVGNIALGASGSSTPRNPLIGYIGRVPS